MFEAIYIVFLGPANKFFNIFHIPLPYRKILARPLVVDQSFVGLTGSFTVRRMPLNQDTFVRFLPMLLLQKLHSDVIQHSQAIVSETQLVS